MVTVNVVAVLVAGTARAEDAPPWTLADVVRMAQGKNPAVDSARRQLDALERQMDEAWWAWFPTIKWRTVATVIPQQGEPPKSPSEPDLTTQTNFWTKTDLEAYIPIYTFGKITAVQAQARHGADMGRQGVRVVESEVAWQTSRAWYGVQLSAELARLIDEGESNLEKAKKRLERLEAEDSSDFDQDDKFRLRMYEADVAKIVKDNRRLGDMARDGLRIALALKKDEPLRLPAEPALELLPVTLLDLDAYVDVALRERPELLAGRHKVAVQRAELDRRWAEFFPDFFIAAGFTYAWSTVDFDSSVFSTVSFNSLGGAATFGFQLTLDYPQKVARYRRAQADLERVQADVASGEGLLRLEIEDVWRETRDLGEMVGINEQATRAARALFVSKAQAYENGVDDSVTMKEVLEAAVTHLQRKSEWLRSVYAFNTGVSRLSRVIGTDVTKLPPPSLP